MTPAKVDPAKQTFERMQESLRVLGYELAQTRAQKQSPLDVYSGGVQGYRHEFVKAPRGESPIIEVTLCLSEPHSSSRTMWEPRHAIMVIYDDFLTTKYGYYDENGNPVNNDLKEFEKRLGF